MVISNPAKTAACVPTVTVPRWKSQQRRRRNVSSNDTGQWIGYWLDLSMPCHAMPCHAMPLNLKKAQGIGTSYATHASRRTHLDFLDVKWILFPSMPLPFVWQHFEAEVYPQPTWWGIAHVFVWLFARKVFLSVLCDAATNCNVTNRCVRINSLTKASSRWVTAPSNEIGKSFLLAVSLQ